MQSKRIDEADRGSLTLDQYCWNLFPSMISLITEVGFHSCQLQAIMLRTYLLVPTYLEIDE